MGILLVTTLLAGAVVPYVSPLFARMTGLKTLYGEVSLSLPKAGEHIIFQVNRDRLMVETLDYIDKRLPTLLVNDLDYLALKPNPQKEESARGMQPLLSIVLQPLIKCANKAIQGKDDLTSIKNELRPVVQEFRRLIQAKWEKEHDTFLITVWKSWMAIRNLSAEPSECDDAPPYLGSERLPSI